jgi:hypothetical protein
MNEYVWSIISPDEAVSLGIVKPLHGSLHFDQPPETNVEISHGGRRITLTPLKIQVARSVPEWDFESIEQSCVLLEKSRLIPVTKTIQT